MYSGLLTLNLYRLNIFANALNELGKARANVDDVFTALREVYLKCQGAFAVTAMLTGFGILGFRQVALLKSIYTYTNVLILEMRMAFGPFASDHDHPLPWKELQIIFSPQNLLL